MPSRDMHAMSFTIDDETHDMLREIAKAEDRSQSWIMRQMIRDRHKELFGNE